VRLLYYRAASSKALRFRAAQPLSDAAVGGPLILSNFSAPVLLDIVPISSQNRNHQQP